MLSLHPAMLHWTITFFILAIIAGVFGFFTLVGGAAVIAKILFVIFLVLLVITTFTGGSRDKTH